MAAASGSEPAIVETLGAARRYGGGPEAVLALAPLDFCAGAGEFVVIRGRSGSGKTTLLNLLGLLDRPSQGRLRFLGRYAENISDRQRALLRRGHLGYVLQDSGVIEQMSAIDNVALPALYSGLPAGERTALAKAALDSVGLSDKARRLVGALSGGERMRVGLARALVLNPKLIICDEPTASLDAETSEQVMDRLMLAAREGGCVIAASHDPIVIGRASRTLALEHGRVVEVEPA